jgi:uncharacterized membrane protein
VPNVSRERVTAFTDAAVAIALTLLVLPLVDTVRDPANRHPPLHTMLGDHARDFLAFGVSFVVIARFWRVHRRLFDAVAHLDEALVGLNVAWLFGIVFLPVPTAVLVVDSGSAQGAAALYAVNLLFIALTALAMSVWIARHPALWETGTDGPALRDGVARSASACLLMAAVVPVALWLGQWALLLLLLLRPAQRLGERLGEWLRGRSIHRQSAKS